MRSPTVNFRHLDESGIAEIGLRAAEVAFLNDVGMGLTNNDSLCILVGTIEGMGTPDMAFQAWGSRNIGPDAEQFAGNIDAHTGKLATAITFRMNSLAAYEQYGDSIPEGPQRYTGAVFHIGRVKTVEKGWRNRVFVGAASGVQGHFDQATTYSALTRMEAAWALQQQTLYGKAE